MLPSLAFICHFTDFSLYVGHDTILFVNVVNVPSLLPSFLSRYFLVCHFNSFVNILTILTIFFVLVGVLNLMQLARHQIREFL